MFQNGSEWYVPSDYDKGLREFDPAYTSSWRMNSVNTSKIHGKKAKAKNITWNKKEK